jgi:hypothetical protein
VLLPGASGESPPAPHIRLDRALAFLIGDWLMTTAEPQPPRVAPDDPPLSSTRSRQASPARDAEREPDDEAPSVHGSGRRHGIRWGRLLSGIVSRHAGGRWTARFFKPSNVTTGRLTATGILVLIAVAAGVLVLREIVALCASPASAAAQGCRSGARGGDKAEARPSAASRNSMPDARRQMGPAAPLRARGRRARRR